ncbi:MAG: hypothetical protein L0220_08430 [Acidobacteria bacterium]|nr:hypothetical protein [Acidobacteriota bacterium]
MNERPGSESVIACFDSGESPEAGIVEAMTRPLPRSRSDRRMAGFKLS